MVRWPVLPERERECVCMGVCVCVCVRVSERQRWCAWERVVKWRAVTHRKRERQRDTHRERERERQRGTETHRDKREGKRTASRGEVACINRERKRE